MSGNGERGMQDLLALAIAVLAAGWLVRTLARRLVTPSCRPADDGFVPIDVLSRAPHSRASDPPTGRTTGPGGRQ